MDDRDLVRVLTKFHREVFAPDFERIVATEVGRLRDEMRVRSAALSEQIRALKTIEARIDD